MGFKSFMKAWGRNISDCYGTLVSDEPMFGSQSLAASILIHALVVFTFPVSLTLGTLFKTIGDIFTRKTVEKHVLATKKEDIDTLEDVDLNNLVSNINAYNPISFSGKKLKADLMSQINDEQAKLQKDSNQQMRALKVDQYCNNPGVLNSESNMAVAVLDEIHKATHEDYNTSNKAQMDKTRIANQKSLIKNYLSDDLNNGTKTMQIIMGLFKPQQSPQTSYKIAPLTSLPLKVK